jgi:hypothetical protein
MDSKEIQAALRPVLDTIKTDNFVPGYNASDEEAMGLAVSGFFEWDGISVLKVAEYALEDSNFHDAATEAAEIRERQEADFA